jgi:Putative zinc-finger
MSPFEPNSRTLHCEEWEALLADALDGALTDKDRASFEQHTAECPTCPMMLSEAEKGQQWLQFLHPEPSIPADLLQRILAKTSGGAAVALAGVPSATLPVPAALPEWKRFPLPMTVRRYLQPRMMMTAAMAFFSIALTLNMAGIRLTGVRAQDLRPSTLRSNLERQFYTAKAPVVRYYENLRVVYEVESKMRELRRTNDTEQPAAQPKPEPEKAPTTNENGGSAHKSSGKSESPHTAGPPIIFVGRPLEACLHNLPGGRNRQPIHEVPTRVTATSLFPLRADQAERSLA